MSGPLEGTVRALTDGQLSLGRDTANQIMIGDSAVSRKHCTISQVSKGVYEISDIESHNGTFVNGSKVTRTPVQHGDRIRVGTSEFVFLTAEDKDTDGGAQTSGVRKQTISGTLATVFLDQRSGLPSTPQVLAGWRATCLHFSKSPTSSTPSATWKVCSASCWG